MTVTYYGHSAVLVAAESPGASGPVSLLFDPFITGNPHAEGVVSPDDLSPDALLVTHAHFDHYGDTESILERSGATLICPFEIMVYVQKQMEHTAVQPMNTGGTADLGWGRVTNTFARHSSSFKDGTYGGLAGGYVVEVGGKTVYHAGDTALFGDMARIGERFDIDLAFLPIGDVLTMGPEDAVEAARMLQPALTVPLHYGTFPFLSGQPDDFVRKMASAGMEARAMEPGERLTL